MPRLTKRLVDAATVNSFGIETFVWDADVKGFGVRVKPTGAKSFVLKYRIATKTRRYTISKVGSPYTVEGGAADCCGHVARHPGWSRPNAGQGCKTGGADGGAAG
jgi:hypothetical protein